MTSMVGGQLTLSLVRNANNSGSDLKETIRLAILHLQKTKTGNAVKTITKMMGFAQAIAEADTWKKARDAAAGHKYVPLSEKWIQKLFVITEELPPAELLPAKRKKQILDQTSRDGDRQCGKTDASKDSAALLGQHSQATGHGGGVSHTQTR